MISLLKNFFLNAVDKLSLSFAWFDEDINQYKHFDQREFCETVNQSSLSQKDFYFYLYKPGQLPKLSAHRPVELQSRAQNAQNSTKIKKQGIKKKNSHQVNALTKP